MDPNRTGGEEEERGGGGIEQAREGRKQAETYHQSARATISLSGKQARGYVILRTGTPYSFHQTGENALRSLTGRPAGIRPSVRSLFVSPLAHFPFPIPCFHCTTAAVAAAGRPAGISALSLALLQIAGIALSLPPPRRRRAIEPLLRPFLSKVHWPHKKCCCRCCNSLPRLPRRPPPAWLPPPQGLLPYVDPAGEVAGSSQYSYERSHARCMPTELAAA